MARPDSTPTDARLFPLEANHACDLDAKALDEIERELSALTPGDWERIGDGLERSQYDRLVRVVFAVRSTGRKV